MKVQTHVAASGEHAVPATTGPTRPLRAGRTTIDPTSAPRDGPIQLIRAELDDQPLTDGPRAWLERALSFWEGECHHLRVT